MGPEKFFSSGMWIIPLIMMIVCMIFFRFGLFGGRGFRPPWQENDNKSKRQVRNEDSPIEILKNRYAKGELSKEEYDSMKNDLS